LLETAVRQIKGERVVEEVDPEIHLPVVALLPQEYVLDTGQRLQIYRRLSAAKSEEDVENIRDELADVFGALPQETRDLLEVMHIRVLLKRLRIRKLDYIGQNLVLFFDEFTPVSPGGLVEIISQEPGRYYWISEHKLMVRIGRGERNQILQTSKKILNLIARHDNSLNDNKSCGHGPPAFTMEGRD
jgi:transcription-repair coupling factor (superfamily II helicase)